MTNLINKPAYLDKVAVINKITIAPGEDREITLLLEPHIGEKGREKDASIIAYFLSQSDLDETDLLLKFASDPEMMRIASIVLDLDDEEGQKILNSLTLWDCVCFWGSYPLSNPTNSTSEGARSSKKIEGRRRYSERSSISSELAALYSDRLICRHFNLSWTVLRDDVTWGDYICLLAEALDAEEIEPIPMVDNSPARPQKVCLV